MKNLELFGEPGHYGASYRDPGDHSGEHLEPCPFCGGDHLEVYPINSLGRVVDEPKQH
uniref:Uncharacterized protein n=1 Tax=Aeromonas salmonicida subsp. salmonicida TaxID=29491 RepID=A0A1Z3MN20_AERSS|nr:hypothetical protein [Aeromonas salmonicida subsp. salmonicida]